MTIDPSTLPYRRGVGLCLFNNQGLVLMAERRDRRGAWQMPQGGIQGNELPHHAALRELKEEIGTNNVQIIDRLSEKLRYEFPDWLQYRQGVFRGKYRGQEQEWFALRYLGGDGDIDLSGEHEPEAPEFIAWKWIPLKESPNLVVDFKRDVYRRLVQDFDKYSTILSSGKIPETWKP